ncbi:transposase [Shewanella sp. SR1]|nr:transposase [Shewanella sp. SR1]
MKFHLVLVTKYRHKCFTDEMLDELEAIFQAQCEHRADASVFIL